MIQGVREIPLQQFVDERGKVMHMLRRDDPWFCEFGETYFSVVNPGAVKGWHLHRTKQLNYACISGLVKLVLQDDRQDSPSFGERMELFIGPEHYCLVQIPPGIWNGLKGLSHTPAIVANCASQPYSAEDIIRKPLHFIEYDWSRRDG